MPSKISIDHMVPLKNAYIVGPLPFPFKISNTNKEKKSGASEWTTDEREAFANDVEGCQLWAVTGTVNSSKSDKSPDEWKPPSEDIHCDYAKAWVQVKSTYDLSASSAEVDALEEMLGTC